MHRVIFGKYSKDAMEQAQHTTEPNAEQDKTEDINPEDLSTYTLVLVNALRLLKMLVCKHLTIVTGILLSGILQYLYTYFYRFV